MPNVTLNQIRTALQNVLQTITPANGYVKTILSTHFYEVFDTATLGRQLESQYPKFYIVTESGAGTKLAARRGMRRVVFLVIVVVKTLPAGDSARKQLEDYIEDVDKAIQANDTLQDTVQDAAFTEYLTDSGNLNPEGAAVLRIECEYFKQF